jgi:hypothetical protein
MVSPFWNSEPMYTEEFLLSGAENQAGEWLRHADALRVTDVVRHVARRPDGIDLRELGGQGRDAHGLHPIGIHVGEVEVAYLLRIRTFRAIRLLRSRGDELVHLILRAVGEDHEGAVVRTIRRDGGVGQPRPAGEPVEVVLRADIAVETREIEAGFQRRRSHRHRDGLGHGSRASAHHCGKRGSQRRDDETIHPSPRNDPDEPEYKKSPKLWGLGA